MLGDRVTRRNVLGAAAATLSAALLGCRREQSQNSVNPNRERIENGLRTLLEQNVDDAFVVFEEKNTRKFVQFSVSAGHGLFFDLPSQTLDPAEMARARNYLAELGIQPQEYDAFDRPEGNAVGRECYFQKSFGRKVDAAVQVTSEVFRRVYQFPANFELVISEN